MAKGDTSEAEANAMKSVIDAMASGDPEVRKQMEGFWKMLNNMQSDDPSGYKNFIDK